MKIEYAVALICFSLVGCVSTKQTLPPQEPADRIEISGIDLADVVEIDDPETVEAVVQFINDHPSKWTVPWYGPPVASVRINLWKDDEFVGNLGVSDHFITRNYGNFWSQRLPRAEIEEFALSVHPAVHEGAFIKIPDGTDLEKSLDESESKFENIEKGTKIEDIYGYISQNGMTISADYPRFINVTISVLNEGEFADTTISGQYVLNANRSLEKTRFFGVRITKKINSNQSSHTTPASAPR